MAREVFALSVETGGWQVELVPVSISQPPADDTAGYLENVLSKLFDLCLRSLSKSKSTRIKKGAVDRRHQRLPKC